MGTTKLLYNNTKTEKENMDALLIDSGVDLRKQNKIAADSWAVFISLGLRVFHSFPHTTDVNRSSDSTLGHHPPPIAYLDDSDRKLIII